MKEKFEIAIIDLIRESGYISKHDRFKKLFLKTQVKKPALVIANKVILSNGKNENDIKFEKSLLKILTDFKVIEITTKIQSITITLNADDLPNVKIEKIVI